MKNSFSNFFILFVVFCGSVHAQNAMSRIDRINADNNLADIRPNYSYANRINARIKPNITFAPDDSITNSAEVEVNVASDGTVISRRLIKSSGNSGWDNAVLKAIDKTETLPRDIDGKVPPRILISFSPRDPFDESLVRNKAEFDLKTCPKPSYPEDARLLEEEGTVNLKFLIDADGAVLRSEVAQTSGFFKLDEAAREALSKCKFRPAIINGKPTKSWAQIKYTWRLEGGKAPDATALKLRQDSEEAKRRQNIADTKLKPAIQEKDPNDQNFLLESSVKRIALVIGNSSYTRHPLRNPLNDANDISAALKTSGFQVIDLRDASLQQMRAGVRQFGDRLLNNDVGLVYYSGHGVEVKGRNYFIPVNADIQREDEIADQGLDVSLVLEKMSTAGKGVNILIVDACRDDPFGRSFRSSSRGLANMDAPRGTIIAYATSPGKVAQDGDGRNSPYTKNLVRAMQQPNKPIEQVFKEVRRAVQEETKNQQTPWENTSLSGDFFFRVQK